MNNSRVMIVLSPLTVLVVGCQDPYEFNWVPEDEVEVRDTGATTLSFSPKRVVSEGATGETVGYVGSGAFSVAGVRYLPPDVTIDWTLPMNIRPYEEPTLTLGFEGEGVLAGLLEFWSQRPVNGSGWLPFSRWPSVTRVTVDRPALRVPVGCPATAVATVSRTGASYSNLTAVNVVGSGWSLDGAPELPLFLNPFEAVPLGLRFQSAREGAYTGAIAVDVGGQLANAALVAEVYVPSEGRREVFDVAEAVDVMLFMDTSGSMRNGNEDDVRAVATALEQTLAGDWVVHLTQYQGCPVSTSDTTDQVNGDVEGLLATLDGPTGEVGLYATWSALQMMHDGNCEARVRADADVVLVFVSDDDDYSVIVGPVDPGAFLSALTAIDVRPDRLRAAAFVPDGDTKRTCAAARALRYASVVEALHGETVDICDRGPVDATDAMWRTLGRSRFDLAGNPDPATLVVEVDGAVITTWSYDATSRTVVFDTTYRAQPGAQVVVTYSDAEGCP